MRVDSSRAPYLGALTWAQLAAVTNVPSGAEALVSDWGARFFYNGTRWVPVGNRLVLPPAGVNATLTGTTSLTSLASFTIPAGLLGLQSRVDVDVLGGKDGANNGTLSVYFGNTGFTFYSNTGTSFRLSQRAGFTQLGSTNNQRGYISGIGVSAGGGAAGGIDTTASQSLVVAGQLTNTAETLFTWAVRAEVTGW